MAQEITFTLPPTGEVQDQARLVSWQVQPGQRFAQGDVLLEIETDKSVIEIPAPCDGLLLEQVAAVDAMIDGSAVLARFEVEGSAAESVAAEPAEPAVAALPKTAAMATPATSAPAKKPSLPPPSPAVAGAAAANPQRELATPAARACCGSFA